MFLLRFCLKAQEKEEGRKKFRSLEVGETGSLYLKILTKTSQKSGKYKKQTH